MPGYTRHQLKEDKLADAAKGTVTWAGHHRKLVSVASTALLVAAVVGVGGWAFLQWREQKASFEMGSALRTYQRPLRPAGTPENPDFPSFASTAERAKAARAGFQKVADQYSYTRSGRMARYYVGLTAMEGGDTAAAERELKAIVQSGNKDLAPLAKLALASFYRSQKRDAEAIQLYRELIDNPSDSVPKATAQLELGSLYEEKQPAEASKLYQQVRIENPTGVAGEIAAARISRLGK
ncbi:MAG TPA: tetratricopeptide repeat protein [Terriglobales bacterium]|nr:tetratricopeptide repeat protein [Terriglobales bacterium]